MIVFMYLLMAHPIKKIPKLLLQVFVREIHISMVSPPEEGGRKEAT